MSDSLTAVSGEYETTLGRLHAVQTDPRTRWACTVVATAVGLALASLHWSGILAGGALVGLCWPTLRRALVAGFALGVVVLVVALSQFALAGSLAQYLAMGPLLAVSVAVPLVAGPVGASVRGLVPDAPP